MIAGQGIDQKLLLPHDANEVVVVFNLLYAHLVTDNIPFKGPGHGRSSSSDWTQPGRKIQLYTNQQFGTRHGPAQLVLDNLFHLGRFHQPGRDAADEQTFKGAGATILPKSFCATFPLPAGGTC